MANIILKDKHGVDIIHKGIDYLTLRTAEGGTVRFNERAVKVIDVTELPTDKIDKSAVYKLTTTDENGVATVEFYIYNDETSSWVIDDSFTHKFEEKEITENGEYVPSPGVDGFSKVSVNVDTFTDVDEFPTENIDPTVIYRKTVKDDDIGMVIIVDAELASNEAGAALQAAGIMHAFEYSVVDELPAVEVLEAPVTDEATGVVTSKAYIVRSTGEPYYTSATEDGVLSLQPITSLGEYEYKGMIADSAEATEAGVYTIITVGATYVTYALLDVDGTKTFLEYDEKKGWVECGAGGGALEVEDLPTEDIDNNLIYKVKEESEPTAVMWVVNVQGITGDYLVEAGNTLVAQGFNFTYTTKIVDALPETDVVYSIADPKNKVFSYHIYVIKNTGEMYMMMEEDGTEEQQNLSTALGTFHGIISDPSEATEDGIYTLMIPNYNYIYGIPDPDSNKKIYKYNEANGWYPSVQPIEITANGTYDATVAKQGVGELVPGGWYTIKHDISQEDFDTLRSYANENGTLYNIKDVEEGLEPDVVTGFKPTSNGGEVLVIGCIETMPSCFVYSMEDNVSLIGYDDYVLAKGWNLMDPLMMKGVMHIGETQQVYTILPEVFDETTILGSNELLDFLSTKLFEAKIDRDNSQPLASANTEPMGTVNEKSAYESQITLTLDEYKSCPLFLVNNDGFEVGGTEAMLVGPIFGCFFFNPELMASSIIETDAYFMDTRLSLVYFKDLSIENDLQLDGAFQENKWYIVESGDSMGMFSMFDFYFLEPSSSSPACDGYNPIVVNIPNADTIVDVNELPSTVEPNKIYKITEEGDPVIWVSVVGLKMTFAEMLAIEAGTQIPVKTYLVDSLPETMIPTQLQAQVDCIHFYVVKSTGVAYLSNDGTQETIMTAGQTFAFADGGWAESIDDIPSPNNPTFFVVKGDTSYKYGISNGDGTNSIYEYNENHTWEECDSGERLLIDIDELPTENVDVTRDYRVKVVDEGCTDLVVVNDSGNNLFTVSMDMLNSHGASVSVNFHIVDTLPTTPEITVEDRGANNNGNITEWILNYHIYIIKDSTIEPAISKDGSTYEPCSTALSLTIGTYGGIITQQSEAVESGKYYALVRDPYTEYCYGITDKGNKTTIMLYKNGTWVRLVEEVVTPDPETPVEGDETTGE